jgi:hypothetical protein
MNRYALLAAGSIVDASDFNLPRSVFKHQIQIRRPRRSGSSQCPSCSISTAHHDLNSWRRIGRSRDGLLPLALDTAVPAQPRTTSSPARPQWESWVRSEPTWMFRPSVSRLGQRCSCLPPGQPARRQNEWIVGRLREIGPKSWLFYSFRSFFFFLSILASNFKLIYKCITIKHNMRCKWYLIIFLFSCFIYLFIYLGNVSNMKCTHITCFMKPLYLNMSSK